MGPAGAVVQVAVQAGQTASTPIIAPGLTRLEHRANANAPVAIPDIQTLLTAFYRGDLLSPHIGTALAAHGVDLRPLTGSSDDWRREAWKACCSVALSAPPVDAIISGYWKGVIRPDQMQNAVNQAGGNWKHWGKRLDLFQNYHNLGDLFSLWRREGWSPGRARDEIKKSTGMADSRIEDLMKLKDLIPSPSDLIQMSVKDVFDRRVTDSLGLFREFPKEFDHWMKKQGFGGLPGVRGTTESGEEDMTWAHLYWGSHWANIAPGTIFEMLHRLRPGRVPEKLEFRKEEAELRLKVHDYDPAIRDRLISLSYRTLGRIDVRRLHKSKQIDTEEAGKRYQDLGFTKEDSKLLAEVIDKEKDSATLKTLQKRQGEKILSAYRTGLYSDDQVKQLLAAVEWTEQEVAFRVQESKLDHSISFAKSVLSAVKSDFLSGALDSVRAKQVLIDAGIIPSMADWWIAKWNVRLNRRHRVSSTSQVLNWAKRGVIGDDGAVQALSNLGWKEPEIELLKGQIELDTREVQLRAEEKAARTEAARVRAIRQQMDRARQEQDRLRSELAKHSSPAMIAKWLKASYITRKQARARLIALRWPQEDATKHIASAKEESLDEEQYQESQESD